MPRGPGSTSRRATSPSPGASSPASQITSNQASASATRSRSWVSWRSRPKPTLSSCPTSRRRLPAQSRNYRASAGATRYRTIRTSHTPTRNGTSASATTGSRAARSIRSCARATRIVAHRRPSRTTRRHIHIAWARGPRIRRRTWRTCSRAIFDRPSSRSWLALPVAAHRTGRRRWRYDHPARLRADH